MNLSLLVLGFGIFGGVLAGESLWIKYSLGRNIGSTIKWYGPVRHIEEKSGTPSMGGLVFLVVCLLAGIVWMLWGKGGSLLADLGFPLAAGLLGGVDDWIKHRNDSSEGLESLQKLVLQIAVSLPWALWYAREGVILFPGFEIGGAFGFFFCIFIFTGAMNAVNITDGLDGLVAGICLLSCTGFFLMAYPLALLSAPLLVCCISTAAAFLWYNAFPAKVFMGDTGAHFFAGVLLIACMESGFVLLVIPLFFVMGLEVLSVAVQLVAIHCFGKKVFLMSPLHHHFELKGWSENSIVIRFWLVHGAGMVLLFTILGTVGIQL